MTNDVSIATKKTLKERAIRYGLIGMIGLGVYGMVWGVDSLIEGSHYKGRVEKIQYAIEIEDFPLARILIEEYEKEKELKPIDIAKLRLKTKREEGTSRLNRFVANYDIENANKVLEELKKSELYSERQIRNFEIRIEGIKPENLAEKIRRESKELPEKIRTADKKEVTKLCRGYLSKYPDGKNAHEVAEKLILNEFIDLNEMLQNIRDIDKVIDITQILNRDLKGFSNYKTDVSKIITLEDLTKNANTYIQQKIKDSSESNPEELIVGAKVRVLKSNYGWPKDYIAEREYNIPLGSLGKIITEHGRGGYIVEFDKNKTYKWNQEWDLYTYWNRIGHQGLAKFNERELELIKPIDPIKIKEFQVEFEKLKNNYQKFLKSE